MPFLLHAIGVKESQNNVLHWRQLDCVGLHLSALGCTGVKISLKEVNCFSAAACNSEQNFKIDEAHGVSSKLNSSS